jgi:hypothetical protein
MLEDTGLNSIMLNTLNVIKYIISIGNKYFSLLWELAV